jgi:uncharacterized protein (DUF488 family)
LSAALLTVGHGTLSAEELETLLGDAGVDQIVDVRRFPGSRRHPHHAREALERTLPATGVDYCWEERLGGRRPRISGSRHVALRNDSFRAYADWMESPDFSAALDTVLEGATRRTTAVMCSESVWWRCHRRLVSDAVELLRGIEVQHLMHDGTLRPHLPTEGVRVDGGSLVYDSGAESLF